MKKIINFLKDPYVFICLVTILLTAVGFAINEHCGIYSGISITFFVIIANVYTNLVYGDNFDVKECSYPFFGFLGTTIIYYLAQWLM